MKWLVQLPLHYQILIALVLGTGIGIIVNPRDVELPDTQVESDDDPSRLLNVTQRKIHISEDGKSISITYTRKRNGQTVVSTHKAKNAGELGKKFPEWKVFLIFRKPSKS